ncbi:endonuclease NucS domain-containing protein [Salinibacter ruber]|uniref:endonuclease NucS domain-containing protein n=1 Tax=Salinibacter ruber TaxID=146919 RepID=UPI002168F755|nr:endonuclease NucS domain-containing protein [Salinibacter ruber]MCS4173853.1 hypothetical protein [Salinibacter ruber]
MPLKLGVWKLGGEPTPISFSPIDSEDRLEEALYQDISILDPGLMVVGRQVDTAYGTRVDLLAMNSEGDLAVIELKRDRTPREVVAQVLDYASWIEDLSYDRIAEIHQEQNPDSHLEEAFAEAFDAPIPEALNESHDLIVVAAEMDSSTERIIDYLSSSYGVPINAVFFRHFRDNGEEYLARSWLTDPKNVEVSEESQPRRGKKEPWNEQDFYVSFGVGEHRTWEDARRYGFVSGGQGRWYSRTLEQLFPGARVFVHIPEEGYVGVGIVEEEAVPVKEFTVSVDGETCPIVEAPLKAPSMGENADNPEKSEYLVRVNWSETRSREDAIWEKGMFANQNTACKLRNQFTLDRLTDRFALEE